MFQKVIKHASFTSLRKTLIAAATVASLGLFAAPAQASLIGDTVNCSATFVSCNPASSVVGAGSEFELVYTPVTFFSIDLGASSISIGNVFSDSLKVYSGVSALLSDLDPQGGSGTITGIANFVTSGVTGMVLEDISFDDHSVSILFDNSFWAFDSFISFDLLFAEARQQVSEPAALALLGLGLAGIGLARRRQSAK
ncbi:PEP-CTERM sorting domain-containing protein [Emcibacter sp.]|uniref:PEP-CTERM sorting domain-containing protein n=1 Tax=Emcibacter sp. TaxID=1979954 RepID=UPI003A95B0EC